MGRAKQLRAIGETKTIEEWATDRRCVVKLRTLRWRLTNGLELEHAMTKPLVERERDLTAFGETKSLWAWSSDTRCAVPYGALHQRLERGWEFIAALTQPSKSPDCPSKMRTKRLPVHGEPLPDGREVLLEAFGESKTLRGWAADLACPDFLDQRKD